MLKTQVATTTSKPVTFLLRMLTRDNKRPLKLDGAPINKNHLSDVLRE